MSTTSLWRVKHGLYRRLCGANVGAAPSACRDVMKLVHKEKQAVSGAKTCLLSGNSGFWG